MLFQERSMEDKKLLYSFIALTSILNLSLIIITILNFNFYLNNNQNTKLNEERYKQLLIESEELSEKISGSKNDISTLKNKLSKDSTVAKFAEELSAKTAERNIQVTLSQVIETTDSHIDMEIGMVGRLSNISQVVEELEKNSILLEIQNMTISVEAGKVKVNCIIRIFKQK